MPSGFVVSDAPEVSEPVVLADRRRRNAELAEREAALRVAHDAAAGGEAKALVDWLELELQRARRDVEGLRSELELAERGRRRAEQLAHAEAAMRLDLVRDHGARIRRHQADARDALDRIGVVHSHARELAREIEMLRRSADEEGQPRGGAIAGPGEPSRARALALVAELTIARAAPPAPFPAVARAPAGEPPGLGLELAMRLNMASPQPAGGAAMAGALLTLAAERAQADELIARGSRPDPVSDRARAAYLAETIESIARQLDAARAAVELLTPSEAEALERATWPSTVEAERGPGPERLGPAPGDVAPDRLAAALDRLREERPQPEPAPEAALEVGPPRAGAPDPDPAGSLAAQIAAARTKAPAVPRAPAATPAVTGRPPAPARWLHPALKRMLREDPAAVGSVVVRLLPAQRLVAAGPVRYDIALADAGCLAVTMRNDKVRLKVRSTPRPLDEVDFRIEGDLAALGRLLVYGSLRRRLSRRVARVRGERRALSALDWLIREPHSLRELYNAGVRLEPELALGLVASMIEPSWTVGERFAVGHEPPGGGDRVYLLVREGERPRVSRVPPLGPVASTIRCPDEQLLAVLAGAGKVEVTVRGAAARVLLLREWIARAQRDS